MNILLGLYGILDYDGRVLRSIGALKNSYDLTVYSHVKNNGFEIENVKIIKRKLGYYENNPTLSHIYYFFSFVFLAYKLKPKIIYVHDYYLSFTGMIAGFISGAKVVYDSHELLILKKDEKHGFRIRFFSFLERISIKYFSLIFSANEERAIVMKRCYSLKENPIAINNIPSFKQVNDFISLIDLENKFNFKKSDFKQIFIYQGVMTAIRDIDITISKIAQVKDSLILLIGKGNKEYIEYLKHSFKSNSNVRFIGQVDLITLYSFLKIADFGIISYSNRNLNNKYCAPNKLYEYANFNLPVVTSDQRIFKRLFEVYKIGITIQPSDSDFCQSFSKFKELCDVEIEIKKFNSHNKWEYEANKILEAMDKITQEI